MGLGARGYIPYSFSLKSLVGYPSLGAEAETDWMSIEGSLIVSTEVPNLGAWAMALELPD